MDSYTSSALLNFADFNFVVGYESGMTMLEIAKRNNVSERTIYRYKAYYDKMRKVEKN